MLEDVLTVDDLAQYLEIDIPAILELASTGKIPAFKEGENWKFERSDRTVGLFRQGQSMSSHTSQYGKQRRSWPYPRKRSWILLKAVTCSL